VVYLARHGQAPLNESDVLHGLADPPLDVLGVLAEEGRDEGEQLAVGEAAGQQPVDEQGLLQRVGRRTAARGCGFRPG
jgi:broad specificity phosphatase PhoE